MLRDGGFRREDCGAGGVVGCYVVCHVASQALTRDEMFDKG